MKKFSVFAAVLVSSAAFAQGGSMNVQIQAKTVAGQDNNEHVASIQDCSYSATLEVSPDLTSVTSGSTQQVYKHFFSSETEAEMTCGF